MASVDVAKYTTAGARGLSVHFDEEKRMTHEHANPHIDKSLSEKNYFIGAKGYNEVLFKLKERQLELDKLIPPKRISAKRVTCLAAEVPIPKELTDKGLADDFIRDAYKVLEDFFGADNVHGMVVHKDEVHDYIDPKTKKLRTSLEHGHAFITPEDLKHGHGLNAKECLDRRSNRLGILQCRMNEMCLEKYGFEYQTHEVARNLSVEELKTQSLRTEQEVLSQKISVGHDKIHSQKAKYDTNRELLSKQKATLKTQEAKIHKHTKELEHIKVISGDVKDISAKKIWSSEDKDYMAKLALHGERNAELIDEVADLKAECKRLSDAFEGAHKELKASQAKAHTLELDIARLKADKANLSHKVDRLEDFIQSQGLELPLPEIEMSIHMR